MIRSVISSDAGLYTCSNEGYSEGDPATVNVTIINRKSVCVFTCIYGRVFDKIFSLDHIDSGQAMAEPICY